MGYAEREHFRQNFILSIFNSLARVLHICRVNRASWQSKLNVKKLVFDLDIRGKYSTLRTVSIKLFVSLKSHFAYREISTLNQKKHNRV